MAVAQRRTSKCRRNKRRSHNALKVSNLKQCTNCSKFVIYHRVCSCGYYRSQKILNI